MKTSRQKPTLIFLSVVIFNMFFSCCTPENRLRQHPNLLIVFPDQLRAQSLGFMDLEKVLTPNIDRFASQSLVLTQAVTNYPICSPTRAMLMSGKYPHANGVLSNCNSYSEPHGYELRSNERTWPDVLKEKGYSLGYIGKWHLDNPHEPYIDCANNKGEPKWNEWCPPQRRHGFDYWYAYGTYDHHLRPMYWSTGADRNSFHYVDQWGPEHEADMAVRYINNEGGSYRKPDSPFALVVSMNPPHMPYEAVPEEYKEFYKDILLGDLCKQKNIPPAGTQWGNYYRKKIKNYYAMITGIDEQFGRILNTIKEAGLEENTIVIFLSDHGNCLGMHDEISKNNYYEESMRVPFIIHWPGKIRPRHDDLLLSIPDIYPTLLDLMGFSDDIPEEVMGTNYASLFLTGRGKRPATQLYLKVPVGQPELGTRGVRDHRYTFAITKYKIMPEELVLFDNQNDPYQMNNLVLTYPEVVRKLSEALNEWLQKTGDPWLNK
jgi:arylsulfatase A-like enzyme